MQDNAESTSEYRAPGPTYKSLFLAACAIIGSTFGWWFTNFVSDFNALSARVAALEIRDTEIKWTFRINEGKFNSYDEQIRALEREHDRYAKRDRRE